MMHRKQKASFAHISRSEGMTALKLGVNLPLKEKTQRSLRLVLFLSLPPALSVPSMKQLLYETAPAACPAPSPEAQGVPTALAWFWVSTEPPQSPRGATLRPSPLLLLLRLPAARHCQSESAGSTAADGAANGPSFRDRYRRCRRSAAPARALFPCNSLTYIPAWTWLACFFPLRCFSSVQIKSSLLSWVTPLRGERSHRHPWWAQLQVLAGNPNPSIRSP